MLPPASPGTAARQTPRNGPASAAEGAGSEFVVAPLDVGDSNTDATTVSAARQPRARRARSRRVDATSPCYARAPLCTTVAVLWVLFTCGLFALAVFVVSPAPDDAWLWYVGAGGVAVVLGSSCLLCWRCHRKWETWKGANRLEYALSPQRMLNRTYMLGRRTPVGSPLERDVDETALRVEATAPSLWWFLSPSRKALLPALRDAGRAGCASTDLADVVSARRFGDVSARLNSHATAGTAASAVAAASPARSGRLLGLAIKRARQAAEEEEANCAICLNSLAGSCAECEDVQLQGVGAASNAGTGGPTDAATTTASVAIAEALAPVQVRAPCTTEKCPVAQGKCGHRFHTRCILEWLSTCDKGNNEMFCPLDNGPWDWVSSVTPRAPSR